jgi:hypothetical protein
VREYTHAVAFSYDRGLIHKRINFNKMAMNEKTTFSTELNSYKSVIDIQMLRLISLVE